MSEFYEIKLIDFKFYRMDTLPQKIGNQNEEDKLKKLGEKFVTYFSGTFQCNVGQQV